jgi:flagellar motility protein MotE (MotC chaperone)
MNSNYSTISPKRGHTMEINHATETMATFMPSGLVQRRFLPYLSVLILLPIAFGIAGLCGYLPLSPAASGTAVAGEKAAKPPASAEPAPPPPLITLSASDIPLLQSLQERQALLEEREKQLAQREEAVHFIQQQVEEKLASLTTLRKEIGALIVEKEAFEEKRFEHLVKVYEGMKPEEAASLIERLQEDTATKLFYRMKEKKVSQLLGFVKPEVAAKLSERLAALQQKEQEKIPGKEKL